METFDNVWDALEPDPVRAQSLKIRSELMIEITRHIEQLGITQTEAADLLKISQPRVSGLLKGKIGDFRLDALVGYAFRLGLNVSINVAA